MCEKLYYIFDQKMFMIYDVLITTIVHQIILLLIIFLRFSILILEVDLDSA